MAEKILIYVNLLINFHRSDLELIKYRKVKS